MIPGCKIRQMRAAALREVPRCCGLPMTLTGRVTAEPPLPPVPRGPAYRVYSAVYVCGCCAGNRAVPHEWQRLEEAGP